MWLWKSWSSHRHFLVRSQPWNAILSCLRNERRCGGIGWFDEPMCLRSVEVIPGLIRSMNKLQESLQQATLQARMYKLIILFSWGLFAIHYLKHGRSCLWMWCLNARSSAVVIGLMYWWSYFDSDDRKLYPGLCNVCVFFEFDCSKLCSG
mgnify:CR=1 FL=1